MENLSQFKYYIELTHRGGKTETIEIITDNIERSMDQYSRNREYFSWKILKKQRLDG